MEPPFDKEAALHHIDILKHNIELAMPSATKIDVETYRLYGVLSAAQKNIKSLEDFVSRSLHVPTENSAMVARKVFDLPELAERILRHLDMIDVLRAECVDRKMRDVVKDSIKLQRQLFLKPHKSGHFREFDLSWGKGIVQTTKLFRGESNEPAKVRLNIFFENNLPKLGNRVRGMLVCQPPITSIWCMASCCREYDDSYSEEQLVDERYVVNNDGLKLGDLHDAAKDMIADHQLCPYADSSKIDPDGIVRPSIYFYQIIRLPADDPAVFKAKGQAEMEDEKKAFQEKMEEYSIVKEDACNNGEPIPTLAEFEAAVAAAEDEQT